MVLKGYRLWVMGQLDSTCRAPPRERPLRHADARVVHRELQVEFPRRVACTNVSPTRESKL
jgi:hypothetical protein